MHWFFDGLGTLLVGLIVGGGAGAVGGYRIGIKSVRQTQKAESHATQTQVGRDQNTGKPRKP